MKRFPFPVFSVFILLLVFSGIVSAETAETTAAAPATTQISTDEPSISQTPADATVTPDRTGGSIYFETVPKGASVWLDNVSIGTTPFTYYTEKTGTLGVRLMRKGYEDYTGFVTVTDGGRAVFSADLIELPRESFDENIPEWTPVSTATTLMKSTINVPTPWPTSSPQSPVNPAPAILAIATGILFVVIRNR